MMDLNSLFLSVMEQDRAPVVICDLQHTVVYMNPAAKERYAYAGGGDLLGKSLLGCHSPATSKKIERILALFRESRENNIYYEDRNNEENKDVYTVALRDESGELIGYYEKHEYRDRETAELRTMIR